jgi:hypothetical protein
MGYTHSIYRKIARNCFRQATGCSLFREQHFLFVDADIAPADYRTGIGFHAAMINAATHLQAAFPFPLADLQNNRIGYGLKLENQDYFDAAYAVAVVKTTIAVPAYG